MVGSNVFLTDDDDDGKCYSDRAQHSLSPFLPPHCTALIGIVCMVIPSFFLMQELKLHSFPLLLVNSRKGCLSLSSMLYLSLFVINIFPSTCFHNDGADACITMMLV